MKTLAIASAALLSIASQALAADDPKSPPATTAAAPTMAAPATATPGRLDPNAVICKREDTTGTRLGASKICHTRQEWADRAAASRDAADKLVNRANIVR